MVRDAPLVPPLDGEPLPIELVNTTFVDGGVRGRVVDTLTTPSELDAWLARHREQFSADLRPVLAGVSSDVRDLGDWLDLREAIRGYLTALAGGANPAQQDLVRMNDAAVGAAHYIELQQADSLVARRRWHVADPLAIALGEVASTAAEYARPERRSRLRACQAPGCILFFEKTHPRREWCSPACGNRVRVARHARSAR